ncbi:hypothetical protein DM01DRAFT_250695 [Hesseltinella vesiculosa]|uniref:Pentacotripeptide-repeat region of PRORP domain-containing protein n=1 Tax=Hesseltinella vesiculosa TaxID=101127 RepID=A0A1X2G771_9FUNG|nr:hypothetical protein DM01DRAFT_250695 [Hesseltinella vesiculosa]
MKRQDMIPAQPIFANLISECIKSHQIDRAWTTFDAMRLSYHQPDEVTFTLMLHACAKMQDVYGFEPDLITYNTLIGACARKQDLARARDIMSHLVQHTNLSPDNHTFTNLLWAYANYQPGRQPDKATNTSTSDDALASQWQVLLPTTLPQRRSQVVAEADGLFAYYEQQPASTITTALLTSYLNTHIMQRQWNQCLHIYQDLFNTHQCKRLPTTFAVMLRYCYETKSADAAWAVWDDYQQFLEDRLADQHSFDSEMEKKKWDVQRQRQQVSEGWTLGHQRKLVLLMAGTLAR